MNVPSTGQVVDGCSVAFGLLCDVILDCFLTAIFDGAVSVSEVSLDFLQFNKVWWPWFAESN